MYALSDIKHIHLEITSKCNAGCPMCPRHYPHTSLLRESVGNIDMTLDIAKQVLQKSLLKTVSRINFCGNFGDAIANKDFIDIVEYIRSVNPNIYLILTTNAGARDTKFWVKVARLINRCDFGIDGLSDTNHIYRQSVNWNLLERNVITYINESIKLGKQNHSTWVMNIFKHNEHQIQEAKRLASKWKISNFKIRITDRFDTWGKNGVNAWPVVDKNMNISHIIYPKGHDDQVPIDPINMVEKSINSIKTQERDNNNTLTSSELETLMLRYGNDDISCDVSKAKSIYIDYHGKLYPCCYFAVTIIHPNSPRSKQIAEMYSKYGKNFNDLKTNSVENIFDSGIFEEIEDGWYKKDIKSGKNATCIYKCGKSSARCAVS
jgi:MoaA/NifB/PqqE/SkfB family radical SAM enzyme